MATQITKTTTARPEDRWLPARLIPTSGIKGVDEQENRATSALLSVMMSVPEFGRALLRKTSAPSGTLRTYIEPPFETAKGKLRPDGALVVRRGATEWKAFVEVKTSTNELSRDQIEGYLDLAREVGVQAVISISNQLTTSVQTYPLEIDRRKTKKVALYHWSWVEILSEAVLQREFRGVGDPDQAWILGELIAYLEHPQSGAMEFQDMGPSWVSVRESSRDGTLRATDEGIADVVARWDQFMEYLCLFLGRDLGVKVTHVLPRRQNDAIARRGHLLKNLVDSGTLDGTLRVQNAIGEITISASLRTRDVSVSLAVDAPNEGRPATRVNWLVRQLPNAPSALRIDASLPGVRSTTSAKLGDVREDVKSLLPNGMNKAPRAFTISMTRGMGTKRGGTEGSFVSESTRLLLDFYRDVVQVLRPWRAAPARLPDERDVEDIGTQPESVLEEVARQQTRGAPSDGDGEPPE